MEALERATRRVQRAVAFSQVAEEFERDAELDRARPRRLINALGYLAEQGRLVKVRNVRGRRSRVYYTTLHGPRRPSLETPGVMDVAWKALRSFWRVSGGGSFTTGALRRYAATRADVAARRDEIRRRGGWPNILLELQRQGLVSRDRTVGTGGRRHVWWTLGDLTAVRTEAPLMRTPRGGTRLTARPLSATTMGAVLPATESLRDIVAEAQDRAAARCTNDRDAIVVRRRPVGFAGVWELWHDGAHGTLRTRHALSDCLYAASRFVPSTGARSAHLGRSALTTPLMRYGDSSVGAWYAPGASEPSAAYVAVRQKLVAFQRAAVRRSLREFVSAEAMAKATGAVAPGVLAVRARALRDLSNRHGRALRSALRRALRANALLEDEAHVVRECIAIARDVGRYADRAGTSWVRTQGTASGPVVCTCAGWETGEEPSGFAESASWIDVARAYAEIESFCGFSLRDPRTLSGRFKSVPVRYVGPTNGRGPDSAPRVRQGGQQRHGPRARAQLDRVRFAVYVLARYARPGGAYGVFVRRAGLALGDLRDPRPFARALRCRIHSAGHLSAACALGVLDCPRSRDALGAYLIDAVHRRTGAGRASSCAAVSPAAVEAAVLGLAPLPAGGLAPHLRRPERHAIDLVAGSQRFAQASHIARQVLLAWDEGWGSSRLLRL